MKLTGLLCLLIIGLISLTHSIQISHSLNLGLSDPNQGQFIDTKYWYRLTTQWQGDGKSLDIINDGQNNKIQLADTGDFSGQYWAFEQIPPKIFRRYKLITMFTSKKCLTVVNDGKGNNQLQMRDPILHDITQSWKLTRDTKTGWNRIVPMSQTKKSIDIINDGKITSHGLITQQTIPDSFGN